MRKLDYLRKIFVLSSLSDEELSDILRVVSVVKFRNRDIVIAENSPGDSVFFILKGKIQIYRESTEGKIKTLSLLSEGDFFGEMSILAPALRCASAKALGSVRLLKLKARDFQKVIKEKQAIALAVLEVLCRRLRTADRHIEILSYQSVPRRIVQILLNLVSSASVAKRKATIQITQKELAEMVASAREVVNRVLQQLRKRHLVRLKKGLIEIPNIKKLRDFKVR